MVCWWSELGFVVKKGDKFVEDERKPKRQILRSARIISVPTAAEINRAAA